MMARENSWKTVEGYNYLLAVKRVLMLKAQRKSNVSVALRSPDSDIKAELSLEPAK